MSSDLQPIQDPGYVERSRPERRVVEAAPATRLSLLTPEQAVNEWDVIGGLLELAIPSTLGRLRLEDVRCQIQDGLSTVVIAWNPDPVSPVIHAAFLINAEEYPLKKVFRITLCGGSDISDWGHLYPQFREIAKELGFDQIEISGRPGWSKFIDAVEVDRNFVEDLSDGI